MTEIMSINEDTVECFFYSSSEDKVNWNELCSKINKQIEELYAGHIWHKDRLQLVLPVCDKDVPEHLYSCTCFGDNIEDEWLIVYLLLQISQKNPNIVIQVRDNDGDFLLIEAADHLPKWAKPEDMENRVFIYNSKIHIIPPTLMVEDETLNIKEALDIVVKHPDETVASNLIQESINKMIQCYPEKIQENLHKSVVKVPLELATILTMNPHFISPLVHAYCNHDVIDVKSCRDINYDEYVHISVNFTKCLYAMLLHSKPFKSKCPAYHNTTDKKNSMGLKLTCGYKIIMNTSSSDIFCTKSFGNFMKNLEKNGFFKENLKGSKDYQVLLEHAKTFYKSTLCPINENVCNKMNKLIASEEFSKQKADLQNKDLTDLVEDSDEWLNINPEQLNDMLDSRYGSKAKIGSDITAESLSKDLSKFLYQTSDFEGIELEKSDDEDEEIEFDADTFAETLKKMLNFVTNEEAMDTNSDSDEFEESMHSDDINTIVDEELKESLLSDNTENPEKDTLKNITISLKEEQAFAGPSSNILKNIGISKTDILDSDDDEE